MIYYTHSQLKGVINMTENEKRIIFVFIKVIPLLSNLQQEKLLSFAEGMAFIAEKNKEKEVCKMIESKS